MLSRVGEIDDLCEKVALWMLKECLVCCLVQLNSVSLKIVFVEYVVEDVEGFLGGLPIWASYIQVWMILDTF